MNITKLSVSIALMLLATTANATMHTVKGSLNNNLPADYAADTEATNQATILSENELKDGAGTSAPIISPKFDAMDDIKGNNYKNFVASREKIPEYLRNLKVTMSKRLQVLPDGKIRFVVTPNSLMENINSLLSHTYGTAYFPKDFPTNMRMYNQFFLYGDNVLDIIDQLIQPFSAKSNVHAYTATNNVIEFTYTSRDY